MNKEANVEQIEKKVDEYRQKQIELWLAKKVNKIKNLEANIKKVRRDIKEFKPEELEIIIEEEQNTTTTWDSTCGTASLTLNG